MSGADDAAGGVASALNLRMGRNRMINTLITHHKLSAEREGRRDRNGFSQFFTWPHARPTYWVKSPARAAGR